MDISQLLSNPGLDSLQTPETQVDAHSIQGGKRDELKAAAMKFEGVFVRQVLKQMQETIENASFDPEDSSNQQVHGMYCTFLGDMIAQKGGFGLWEKIYEEMVDMEKGQVTPEQQQLGDSLNQKV